MSDVTTVPHAPGSVLAGIVLPQGLLVRNETTGAAQFGDGATLGGRTFVFQGDAFRPSGARIVEPAFPAYAGTEPAGPMQVYASTVNGTAKLAISAIATNGDGAVPFNTAGAGDICAFSGWVYRTGTGSNPVEAANFGVRYTNLLGAVTWGCEIDINNEAGTPAIGNPNAGEALVLNTGSTYSPGLGIHITRATGEGTGPGWLRGIFLDGVRRQGIVAAAMSPVTYPGLVPAAPGTLDVITSYVSNDANVRFTLSESGRMDWGSGAAPQDTYLVRGGGGGLITGTVIQASAFWVAAQQIVGPRINGWGTPTGAVQVADFPGASATLAQTSSALSAVIQQLKTHGLLGA